MALKTKEIRIEDGPDAGVVFTVTQMSLIAGDNWSNRVALALCRSGVDIESLGLSGDGFKGLLDMQMFNVALKALGGIGSDTAQELLDELMSVIRVKNSDGSTRPVNIQHNELTGRTGDVTCIKTLWKLRIEAIKVNLDFLLAGVTQ